MKLLSVRAGVWSLVAAFALFAAVMFVKHFPENYPEKTLAIEKEVTTFFRLLTLPIKTARLSLMDPDPVLLMPVYNAKVENVADTWHGDRDGGARQHEGQDIFAAKGTPVFSATYGYVRRIGDSTLGGNHVFVTGAGGRRYYYAHFDAVAAGLEVGQEVTKDTVLGFVGNTGNAITTPPHLHFGMYQGREALNPYGLLRNR